MFLKPESSNHLEVSKPPKNFRRLSMKGKKSSVLLNSNSYHNRRRKVSEYWKDKSSQLERCFNLSNGERAKKR